METFADALSWSAPTVTAVGYGDRYPVTRDGRLVAIGLMLAGVAMNGVVTASIASWLIASVRDAEHDNEDALQVQIAGLHTELAEIKAAVLAGQAPKGAGRAR